MLGIGVCFCCTRANFDATEDSILRELKNACMEDPGNPAFWNEVKKRRADLGLITASEAAKHGGKSNIVDKSTEEVRRCTVLDDLTNALSVLVKVIMTIILASAYTIYPPLSLPQMCPHPLMKSAFFSGRRIRYSRKP